MKKEAWRKVFWLIWSAGWIVLNFVLANAGMINEKSIWLLVCEAIMSCFVAYVMANSRFLMVIVVIAMILKLIGDHSAVGIFCFIYNFILVIVTKILTPKETKR